MEDDLAALLSEVSEIEQKVAPVPPVAAPKAPEVMWGFPYSSSLSQPPFPPGLPPPLLIIVR